MHRTFDSETFVEDMKPFVDEIGSFDALCWIEEHDNIALTDGNGNYNLFQPDREGLYYAHTYFNTARGRKAISLCKESLEEIFKEGSPVKAIKGLTPVEKKAARWLNRQVGLTSYGVLETVHGPCELFILDKHTYLERVK